MSSLRLHLIAFAMLALSACAGLPTEGQTGRMAVVRITDGEVSPRDIIVQPGDEVRLLNDRDRPAWIYFGRERPKELSCQRGFSFFWGVEEVAAIKPGESASVCFSIPGDYGYWVQSQPTVQGGAGIGEVNMPPSLPAAIIVESARKSPFIP
jgi:plastocyanin